MPTPLYADLEVSLTLKLRGDYQPYIPERGPSVSSGGEPAEGGFCEDVAVDGLTISLPFRDTQGVLKYREVNLLASVDTTSPAVQSLLANLLSAVSDEAQDALAENLPDSDDYDDYDPHEACDIADEED